MCPYFESEPMKLPKMLIQFVPKVVQFTVKILLWKCFFCNFHLLSKYYLKHSLFVHVHYKVTIFSESRHNRYLHLIHNFVKVLSFISPSTYTVSKLSKLRFNRYRYQYRLYPFNIWIISIGWVHFNYLIKVDINLTFKILIYQLKISLTM